MSGGWRLARGRLADARGGRIVLVAHCLLNQHARYAGGASAPGCLPAALGGILSSGAGVVQMPCPEVAAWGGPWKRLIWLPYGRGRAARALAKALYPAFLLWTRAVFAGVARNLARRAAAWRRAGWELAEVVGIDGSPSCGVAKTLGMGPCLALHSDPTLPSLDRGAYNARLYAECAREGRGLFTAALGRALARRGIRPGFRGWDLEAELRSIGAVAD